MWHQPRFKAEDLSLVNEGFLLLLLLLAAKCQAGLRQKRRVEVITLNFGVGPETMVRKLFEQSLKTIEKGCAMRKITILIGLILLCAMYSVRVEAADPE